MSRIRALVLALAAFAPVGHLRADDKPARFAKEIAAFEKQEKDKPVPKGAIIFLGSSSIRLWKLDKSFPGLDAVNRGFGGSQVADAVHYAPRLLYKQQPRMIVVYAGDNDLAAGKTPEQISADFQELVKGINKELPMTTIVYLSIKPSPKRSALMDKQRKTNSLVADFCKKDARLVFVDMFTPLLSTDQKPRPELFRDDKLHLNDKGYDVWTAIVKPHLK